MADMQYQYPMQLLELLGLRGWDASQPRTYWGLKRPDGLPENWSTPNAGLGGGGSWGYQGGYGTTTGGGGGYGTATGVGGGGASLASFLGSQRFGGADVGGAGAGGPQSEPGQGMNATTDSFGDFLGAATTGPMSAFGSFAAQALANGLAGNPGKPITGLGLGSLYDAAQSAFGGGGIGEVAGNPASDPGADRFGGVNENENSDMMSAGAGADLGFGADPVGGDPGYGGGDPGGGADPGYARGGAVSLDRLIGPNPPGPDDGYAALDAGEHVLTADEVRRLGGHAGVMRLRDLIRR